MAEFPAFTLSPARVHERVRALTGHHPTWLRRPYLGGFYSTEHFRVCSWCGCIHPGDMLDLLQAGASSLEPTAKAGKYLFLTPNPIGGTLVRMGSQPVPVFNWKEPPRNLRIRLKHEASERDATAAQRLIGHIERPLLEPAPEMIRQAFFDEHSTRTQWAQIEAAAATGDQHGPPLQGP